MYEDQKEDMFTKTIEKREIIDFINCVKRHPCLYDTTSIQYSNAAFTRKAWADIARKCNSNIPKCKDKWRGIRTAFLRATRMGKIDEKRKPYYLKDHLQFIIPFTKFAEDASLNTSSQDDGLMETTYKEETSNDKNDDNFDDSEEYINDLEAESDNNDNMDDNFDLDNRHEVYLTNSDGRRRFEKRRKQVTGDLERHPRKMFLLSLLPDIEAFNEQEMRVFRREVIKSIDNIISDRETRNN